MHYRLSNENQEEKKCLKLNIYFVPSFKQKQVVPFGKVKNYQYFATIIFSRENAIFWRFWPKNWRGWSDNFETFHNEKSGVLEKKPRK